MFNIIHQYKIKQRAEELQTLNYISFLFGFASSLTAYIIPFYFKNVSGIDNTSFFYIVSYFLVLIFITNLHRIISKTGKSKTFLFSLLSFLISSLVLLITPTSWLGAFFLILNIVFYSLCVIQGDIILELFTMNDYSGRAHGLNQTTVSFGFIFGPLIAAWVMTRFGFQMIFLVQSIIILIILSLGARHLGDLDHYLEPIRLIRTILKKIFKKQKNFKTKIFYISFLLEFFSFASMVYFPIYLKNIGISFAQIGIIMTIMFIPFLLLSYPIGVLADKHISEKKLIIIAILIISFATFRLYFIESNNFYTWSGMLFFTQIGVALLCVVRDSYFFRQTYGEDVREIDIFRSAWPLGYILSAIISGLFLIFLPLKFIFILVSIMMFSGLLPALYLKD